MKRRRSPSEKKFLEYTRDTRVTAEYPKAYRKSKPRKKKIAAHRDRRRFDRMLSASFRNDNFDSATRSAMEARPARKIKNLVTKLGDRIKGQQEKRKMLAHRKKLRPRRDDLTI